MCGGRVIYIVENDRGVRDALSLLLEGLGHHAISFADGGSFMSSVTPREGDVVFIDLKLPDMPGERVINKLRQTLVPAQIVAISGSSQFDLDRIVHENGIGNILRKPLEEKHILEFLPK
ncbi:response regulator [Flexibacterium corallicola]|uniref:response regulator n=1 Tax=Flexibacterium corallicola TaxID=3037259 RepID=UPI00286FA431|nr:response regulator [Pseudovibrio sp. M1P-2-3]